MSQPPAIPDPPDVDLLAAALRADSEDLEVYSRVLTESLVGALPTGMVEIARDPSMRDRIAGRPGPVRSVRIAFGDTTLELASGHGAPVARCARAVRGVIISSKEISVDEWTRMLADQLALRAKDSADARAALGRLLGAG